MKIGKAATRNDLQVRKPAGWLVQECFRIPDHEDLITPPAGTLRVRKLLNGRGRLRDAHGFFVFLRRCRWCKNIKSDTERIQL